MNGRRKKPSADGAKKADKHLESNHADEFKNGDGATVPRSTGTLHTLSPKRRRQLESAFGVRPRGGLSWVEAELLDGVDNIACPKAGVPGIGRLFYLKNLQVIDPSALQMLFVNLADDRAS